MLYARKVQKKIAILEQPPPQQEHVIALFQVQVNSGEDCQGLLLVSLTFRPDARPGHKNLKFAGSSVKCRAFL